MFFPRAKLQHKFPGRLAGCNTYHFQTANTFSGAGLGASVLFLGKLRHEALQWVTTKNPQESYFPILCVLFKDRVIYPGATTTFGSVGSG